MSFALNQEIMKKSFMMGDDGNRFTHNAAKKIKLFFKKTSRFQP